MTTQKYERVDITLPSDLLKRFEEYCEKEGMKISSRMAVLIRKDLEKMR
jgi:metal-responsive CopG/Arc/MetJ family transcriptional regulator